MSRTPKVEAPPEVFNTPSRHTLATVGEDTVDIPQLKLYPSQGRRLPQGGSILPSVYVIRFLTHSIERWS
jgi:hypothetical protein